MLRYIDIILFLILFNQLGYSQAQKADTIYVDSIPQKILYDKKIYKLNAGFFTLAGGYYLSNNLSNSINGISLNFNFHIFKECYTQVGLIRLKGEQSFQFPQKKDVIVNYFNFLISPIVFKRETLKFAFIFNPIGITYGGGYKDEIYHYKGSIAQDSTNIVQNNYFGFNLYSSIQCIYKFKYDLGIGASVYAEYFENGSMITGINLCFYFSAAFRGNQTKPTWYYKKNPDKE